MMQEQLQWETKLGSSPQIHQGGGGRGDPFQIISRNIYIFVPSPLEKKQTPGTHTSPFMSLLIKSSDYSPTCCSLPVSLWSLRGLTVTLLWSHKKTGHAAKPRAHFCVNPVSERFGDYLKGLRFLSKTVLYPTNKTVAWMLLESCCWHDLCLVGAKKQEKRHQSVFFFPYISSKSCPG